MLAALPSRCAVKGLKCQDAVLRLRQLRVILQLAYAAGIRPNYECVAQIVGFAQ
jgi:hypothetical protein